VTLHITQFEGGNALSDFRVQQLLPRLKPSTTDHRDLRAPCASGGIDDTAPPRCTSARLASLLTYGDPYTGGRRRQLIVVTPRFGTVSPWASQGHRHRPQLRPAPSSGVERITEYRLTLKIRPAGRQAALSREQLQRAVAAPAARPHDRKRHVRPRAGALGLFTELQPAPMEHVDVLGGGRAALEAANTQFWPGAGRRRDRLPGDAFTTAWGATPPMWN
jgi:phosphoribosylformylglycinamidine synthase